MEIMSNGLQRFRSDNPSKHVVYVPEAGKGHCGRLVLARAAGYEGDTRRICDMIFTQLLHHKEFLSEWATPGRVDEVIRNVAGFRDYVWCNQSQWICPIQWKAAAIGLRRHILIISEHTSLEPVIFTPTVLSGLKEFNDGAEAYKAYIDLESNYRTRIRWEKFEETPIVGYNVGNHYNSLVVNDAGMCTGTLYVISSLFTPRMS